MSKVFISGTAGFGTKAIIALPKVVKNTLDEIMVRNDTVLIGDCQGIDTLVQKYLLVNGYKNVVIYCSGSRCRNILNPLWTIKRIPVPAGITGRAFFAVKDKAMANDANYGVAIWDGKSIGTGNNITNMRLQNKAISIYRTDLCEWSE